MKVKPASLAFRRKGFTLIEIMVTMFVAMLVIGSIAAALVNSLLLDEYNEKFSMAVNFARAKIEDIFSNRANFGSIVSNEGSISEDRLKGLWKITVTNADFVGDVKIIEVKVCWQGKNGVVVGDCEDSENDGVLDQWSGDSASCVIKTAIARR